MSIPILNCPQSGDAARMGNRLVDQHVPHFRFRRTSPQWFLVSRFVAKTRPAFRGLWRKSGIDRYRRGFFYSFLGTTPPLSFCQLTPGFPPPLPSTPGTFLPPPPPPPTN